MSVSNFISLSSLSALFHQNILEVNRSSSVKHSEPSSWNSDKDLSEINELHKTTFSAIERRNEHTCFSFSRRTFTLAWKERHGLTQSSSPTSASFFSLAISIISDARNSFSQSFVTCNPGYFAYAFLGSGKAPD